MGVAKPVDVPRMSFRTRKAAKEWVRDNIEDHYELEEAVTDPLHVAVPFDLLDRDDDAAEKIGAGLQEFFVRRTSLGDGLVRYFRRDARGIWIRCTDGSEDDWSYLSAIDQEGIQSDVKDALRAVINEDRLKFRDEAFANGSTQCAHTGVMLTSLHDAEVRYVEPSWSQLTAGFAHTQGGWDRMALTARDGNTQISSSLPDRAQLQTWRDYWTRNARPAIMIKPDR